MKTVELVAPERVQLTERERPRLGPGEVRIAVHTVGICGTDMDFYRGRRTAGYPFVLGHECSGRIDDLAPDVAGWTIGAPVTVRPNFGCGTCTLCHQGRDNICPDSRGLGVTIDGCLAEYVVAPARYVWPLPNGMSLERGALIEPVAVAERAVRRAGDVGGRRVVVLGAGSIGLFALQIARAGGADVTVIDPLTGRLARATELGASRVLDAAPNAAREGHESNGAGFDVAIETAGVSEAVATAMALVRPGGRIVLTGIPMEAAALETRWAVWRELEFVGSFIYEEDDFRRASDRIRDGRIDPLELVTDRFPIDRTADAFERVASRDGLKVLITIRKEEN